MGVRKHVRFNQTMNVQKHQLQQQVYVNVKKDMANWILEFVKYVILVKPNSLEILKESVSLVMLNVMAVENLVQNNAKLVKNLIQN